MLNHDAMLNEGADDGDLDAEEQARLEQENMDEGREFADAMARDGVW
jgi:hypothetical protein